jgi:hypothetical protein
MAVLPFNLTPTAIGEMMNTKQQGAIGVAKAIAYYTGLGYAVFIPVSDVSRYDLVVDDGNGPKRIEVKSTVQMQGRVQLRTLGGNQSWNGVVKFISPDDCDEVFCYNINTGTHKIFTATELAGRTTVTVR